MWLQKQPLVSCSRAGKLQVPLLRVLAAWLMNRGKEWSLFFGTTWGTRCYKDCTDGQFLSVYHYCSKCFMNLICFILTNALREKVTIIFLSVRKPGKHDVCTLLKITQQGGCGHSTDSSHTTPETWDCVQRKVQISWAPWGSPVSLFQWPRGGMVPETEEPLGESQGELPVSGRDR